MSIVVQTVMLALPSKSRMLGLLELIVSSIIGIVIIMLYIVIFNVLGYKEIKHLPFGDKLYQMKRKTVMTHTITIVGLGNYGIDELPLGIYRFRKRV